MFGDSARLRQLMSGEDLKPKNLSETLARFGQYFGAQWPILLVVALLIVVATWTQVTTPELIGQVVDCYLTPAAASAFGNFPGAQSSEESRPSNCWLANDPAGLSATNRLLQSALTAGDFPKPALEAGAMTNDDRIAGLGRMILIIVGLYMVGALLTGFTFFLVTWVGQHVLREMRLDVFRHLHRLSRAT